MGPGLAFRWVPRSLLRLACVSQGVLCLFLVAVGLGTGHPVAAAGFGATGLCFLLAAAGLGGALLTAGAAALFVAALALVTAIEGPDPVFLAFLGLPVVCVAVMARTVDARPAAARDACRRDEARG